MTLRMTLDHFAWSAPDLDKAMTDFESWSGLRPQPGGIHPGMGTRNALVSLGPGLYFAIDAPDPAQDQPGTNGARMAAQGGYRLDLFATATDDLERARQVLADFDIGTTARPGSRKTPSGALLRWRFLQTVGPTRLGPALPHVQQWDTANHPSLETPAGCTPEAFRVYHPLAAEIRALYAALGLEVDIIAADLPRLELVLRGNRGVFTLPTMPG